MSGLPETVGKVLKSLTMTFALYKHPHIGTHAHILGHVKAETAVGFPDWFKVFMEEVSLSAR